MVAKGSSGRWLQRQHKDRYVKAAQQGGWRSRAVFKLEQIDRRDRLLRPGQRVIDLGAAPGGWSQYAAGRVGPGGLVIGVDLLPIEPLPGVELIQGDFLETAVVDRLSARVGSAGLDLVLSDMAPNFSGVRDTDLARAYELAELARDFAVQGLHSEGAFLVKVFQGGEFEPFRSALRQQFRRVAVRKPEASRAESRELYLLAQGPLKADNT